MKTIPFDFLTHLEKLHPGDEFIAHHRTDGWMKMEVHKVADHHLKHSCPALVYFAAFRELPNNWTGNITFFFDFELQKWTYRTGQYPPFDVRSTTEVR